MWDRESAIAAGGRPTEPFAAFCGQLAVGWVILEARDPQAKGVLGALAPVHALELRAGPGVREPPRLPGPTRRLDREGQRSGAPHDPGGPGRAAGRGGARMRPLPARMPDIDRRQVMRVPAQPFVRVDRNDYSIDPRSRAAGSRCASPRPRSPRSCWTPGSSPPASAGVRRRADDHRPGASDPAGAPARPAPPAPPGRRRDPAAVAL